MSEWAKDIQREIDELTSKAESLKDEIEEYVDRASQIDDEYETRNGHRDISLDDLPYGEELARTRHLPDALEETVTKLERLDLSTQPVTVITEIIQEAKEAIERAKSTLDDCTDLPAEPQEAGLY